MKTKSIYYINTMLNGGNLFCQANVLFVCPFADFLVLMTKTQIIVLGVILQYVTSIIYKPINPFNDKISFINPHILLIHYDQINPFPRKLSKL